MNAFRCFLGTNAGLVVALAVAGVGVYLLVTHTGHALAALPYLILLLCPLLHLFGHRHGHGKSKEHSHD